MSEKNKELILKAMLQCSKPLAEIVLDAGLSHRELSEVFRLAMVDVASKGFGLRGRPTNMSRVSIMTGLTRKEVRRLRQDIEEGRELQIDTRSAAEKVLDYWKSHKDYLDTKGQPRTLSYTGKRPSFESLIRDVRGDMPPGAMRTELKRLGGIRELDSGKLKYIGMEAIREDIALYIVDQLQKVAAPTLEQIASSTRRDSFRDGEIYRASETVMVNKEDVSRIRKIWKNKIDELMESFKKTMDAYAMLHGGDRSTAQSSKVSVSASFCDRPGKG